MPRRRAIGPPESQHRERPPFDALAFKQRAQEDLLRAAAGMTPEQERSFYRQRARTGSLGGWWAQVEAQRRAGSMNGGRAGGEPASARTASPARAADPPGTSTSRALGRLLDRLEEAIGERGYEAVVEAVITDDLLGGDDSPLAPDLVMVVPGHRDDVSRPILLAVTRGWNGKDSLSFKRVMRQVKARLTVGRGTVRHVVVFCDAWNTPAFVKEHRDELAAHADQGVDFSFVMVGVPDRRFVPIPVGIDHAPH